MLSGAAQLLSNRKLAGAVGPQKGKGMKVLVNVFHPDLEKSRINKAMIGAIANQPSITVRDMYEEYGHLSFKDSIPVDKEKEVVVNYDRVVFQHPIYWYSGPPLLKKWVEDVLTEDWAFGEKGNDLRGKEWMHAVSCGGSRESYQPGGFNAYSLGEFLRSYQQVSVLCKMNFCPTFAIHHVFHLSDEQLAVATQEYVDTLNRDRLIVGFSL